MKHQKLYHLVLAALFAALTYVAALLMSALQLLRYVLIFVGRNNRGRRDN